MKKRRRHIRQIVRTMQYVNFDGTYGALLTDLSESGLGVIASGPLQANQKVRCRFELDDEVIEGETLVVSADETGRAGLQFTDLSDRDRKKIKDWLFHNALSQGVSEIQQVNSLSPEHPEEAEDVIDVKALLDSAEQGEAPPAAVRTLTFVELPTQPQAAFDLIARRTREWTVADGAAIALDKDGTIRCCGRAGEVAPDLGVPLDTTASFSGQCIQSGHTLVCNDTDFDSRVDPVVCRELNIRSIVASPVRLANTTVGVLEVFSSMARAFGDTHVAVIERMAELLAEVAARGVAGGPKLAAAPARPAETPAPAQPADKTTSHPSASPSRDAADPVSLRIPIRLDRPAAHETERPAAASPAQPIAPKSPAASTPVSEPKPAQAQPAKSAETVAPPVSKWRPVVPPAEPAKAMPAAAKSAPAPFKTSPAAEKPAATPVKVLPAPLPLAQSVTPAAKSNGSAAAAPAKSAAPRPQSNGKGGRMKRSETSATATAAAAEFSAAQDPTGHFAVTEEAPADSSRFKAIGIGAAAVVLIGGSALWFTRSASKQPAVQPATVAAAAPAAVAPATTTPAPAPATATPSSTSAPHPGTDQTPPNAAKPAPQPPPRAAAEQPIAIRPSAAPPATTVVDVAPPAITTSSLQNAAVRSIPLLSNPETPVAAPVLPPTSTGAIPARLITRVQPVYPDQARHLGIGGAIQLSVAIGADGKVQKVTPRSGSAMLIPAAVTAVRQWRYEPSKLDGKAVPSTAEVTINFNVR